MLRNRKGLAAKLLDFFILANLAFLALDVFLAHSVNAFAHSAEWIPFYFSLGASVLLALILFGKKRSGKSGVGSGLDGVLFVSVSPACFFISAANSSLI